MTDPLPTEQGQQRSALAGAPAHYAWERLENQLSWYDGKSAAAQRAYKRVKLAQLVIGAAVPVVTLLAVPRALAAALAAVVVVLEGAQQLYQWQTNWVLYRSTAEALKHERYLFIAHAGPYTSGDRARVLAERVEGLVSQEHAKWTDARHSSEQPQPGQAKQNQQHQ